MTRSAGPNAPRTIPLLVALFLAPVLLGAICGGGDDGIGLPPLEPFTPEQEELLHEIRDSAALVRGLDVNDDTAEGMLTRDQYATFVEERLLGLTDDELKELAATNVALRLLHMIGPDDDLLEIVTTFQVGDVLGFYVQSEDSLVLISEQGGPLDANDEAVLAHEYIHSFQHQAFDFEALDELQESDSGESRTEYGSTVSCVIEGDASLSMVLFMEDRYGADWRDELPDDEDEEPDEDPIPPAFQRYFSFDYRECTRFVSELYEDGGWNAVDQALANPPRTTEQVLHLDKYLEREVSRSTAPASFEDQLGEGWSLLDEVSAFGEFDVYNYIVTILENEFVAQRAAAGWGSGWISIYEQETDSSRTEPPVLVHLQLEWDTTLDFNEFMLVLGEMVNLVSGADWDLDLEGEALQWDAVGEYGFVTWNETLNRVHVVISSDGQARDDAAVALGR